jgi:hypothetical protein
MKKIVCLLSITFLMLQACTSGDSNISEISNNNNVNYSFTIINDGIVYKVQGNTSNDYGFKGPINNKCTANSPNGVSLTITDPSYSNYVSGNPINFYLYNGPIILGTNLMQTPWNLYHQYATPGASGSDTRIPITITDLGTPSVGDLGTSSYHFGNTIKGHYSGTYYSIPSGSNTATVPHTISIEFEAVRLY